MDYEFFARLYHNNCKFQYIERYISCFYYGGTSCRHPFKTIFENYGIAEKYGLRKSKKIVCIAKAGLRNSIKIALEKVGLYSFLYGKLKRNGIADVED